MTSRSPLSRRDFLRLRVNSPVRTLEVSCQALYMRFLEAETGAAPADYPSEFDGVMGEPPSRVDGISRDELRDRIEQDLQSADELRLIESRWLNASDLAAFIQPLLVAFEARGGVIIRDN